MCTAAIYIQLEDDVAYYVEQQLQLKRAADRGQDQADVLNRA